MNDIVFDKEKKVMCFYLLLEAVSTTTFKFENNNKMFSEMFFFSAEIST